jgi:hypothetical protein
MGSVLVRSELHMGLSRITLPFCTSESKHLLRRDRLACGLSLASPLLGRSLGRLALPGRLRATALPGRLRPCGNKNTQPTYCDEKVANRDTKVWHFVIDEWLSNDGHIPNPSAQS